MTLLEPILSKIPEKTSARRRKRRRAEPNPTARGQKISSPKTPPFFARSPKEVVAKKYKKYIIQLLMNKKVLQIITFTSFTISFFFGVLFVTPNSFVFAEGNLPIIITTTPGEVSIDAPFNLLISGNNFGFTPGEIINVNTNQKLNISSPLVSQIWEESSIFINFDTYLVPPNLLQEGVNSFKIKMSSGAESAPFTIIGKKLGSAVITSVIPSTAHVDDEIVINGSGFGTNGVDGKVGTMTDYIQPFYPHQNISWSNNQIRIKLTGFPSVNFTGNTNLIVAARLPDTRLYSSNLFPITIERPVCISWIYSDWGACSAGGQQTRTITNSSPDGCTGGNPVLTQSCTYIPPCTDNDYSCGNWSACSQNGRQTRACDKIKNCQDGAVSIATSQSCTYTPACISFYYSSWSECSQDGKQTRNITSKYPSNCEGGVSPQTTQSCTPSCNTDTWSCGAWGYCSLSGIQTRSCSKTFDCSSVETAPPTTVQYCEVLNRPQQMPQDSSEEILNQDLIIKSTVKLLCPVDAQRASQGSGTVIDPSGVILTNKHVIAGTLGCLIGFINDFNDEPYFGERQIADIFKVSSNQDIAILKIRNPQNKTLTGIDITRGNSNLRLGTKVSTYGFPAKFGTKITYTSGDFSGTDGSYLKTTAILEYGNSGGGAYLKDGTFIGVPSAVVKGELNALGYILSINTINAWLGNLSIVSGGTTNNQYSRVSVLEDIDLETLDSLKLFIPQTDVSGNLVAPVTPTTSQKTQKGTEQPLPSQTQEESTVIESADGNKETSTLQQDQVEPEKEQPLKVSWVKRLFLWLVNLFNKIKEII